jgi:hypothetical protein
MVKNGMKWLRMVRNGKEMVRNGKEMVRNG